MSHTPMSRGRIRHHAAKRCGFRALSTTQFNDLNEEIDNALARMAGDCVEAFALTPVQVDAVQTYQLSNYSAGLVVDPSAPAVLEQRILEITDADGTSLSHATWAPATDGTWDGRMWLRIVDSNGDIHVVQSREWWIGGQEPNQKYYVSLVDPAPFTTPAGTTITDVWIFQRHMWFPGDTTFVNVAGQDAGNYFNTITELSPATARHRIMTLRQQVQTGDVQNIWRDVKFDMPTPTEAPEITVHESTAWDTTAFPKCEIELCYTYVWGRLTSKAGGEGPRGIVEPLWESAPSPTASYTMTAQTGTALVFHAVNIDAQLNFSHPDLNGTIYEGRSGLRIRFYVRVKSLVSGTGDARYKRIETSDRFLLISEIEPTTQVAGEYASFLWDGTEVPDYETLLKPIPGYFGYAMYPNPLTTRVLDFVIRRMPHQLQDDSMVVHMHTDGREALLQLVIAAIRETMGDLGGSEVALNRYKDLVMQLRARYGNSDAFGVPRGQGDDYVFATERLFTFA